MTLTDIEYIKNRVTQLGVDREWELTDETFITYNYSADAFVIDCFKVGKYMDTYSTTAIDLKDKLLKFDTWLIEAIRYYIPETKKVDFYLIAGTNGGLNKFRYFPKYHPNC